MQFCFLFLKSLASDNEEVNLSKESLEVCFCVNLINIHMYMYVLYICSVFCEQVLCLALTLAPKYVPTIMNAPDWRLFIMDVLLLTKNR